VEEGGDVIRFALGNCVHLWGMV